MSPKLQFMLQQAIQDFQSGNLDGAELTLKNILLSDSKNLPALQIFGLIKAVQFKHEEAADYLARAAQINPNDAAAQFNLAKALSDSGRHKDALIHHKKAVALAPNNPDAWINYGKAASYLGHHSDALTGYSNALRLKPNSVEALLNKGAALKDLKRYEEALDFADQALALNSNLAEAWSNKGIALRKLKRYEEAIAHYDKALALKPDYAEALSNKAATFHDLKRYEDALDCNAQALKMNPNLAEAWSNRGVALHELKRYEEAITHFDSALSLDPDYYQVWSFKGITLCELKRYEEGIAHYDKALSIKPDYAEAWANKGANLYELKLYDEAITHYDKALGLMPDYHEAWANKGLALHRLRRFGEAISHYEKALHLKPDYAKAWSSKGVTLHELKRYDEAIIHYDKALSLRPDYPEAWSNKAVTLHELKRYDEAITHCDMALGLNPDIDWIHGDLAYIKMKICSWENLEESTEILSNKVMARDRASLPFALLAIMDNSSLHKKASETLIECQHPLNLHLGLIPKRSMSKKIRVGYFSADFHDHATGHLIAELFELHDKSQFEVHGFSFGPMANDEMRQRLEASFFQFMDVSNESDIDIAQLSRGLNIDIAVDLKGFTQDSRTGIFSYRAAPIQVNYLGYPGTMGANYIDYIIADKTIIPIDSQSCYGENLVYLPNTYQINDRKRPISDKQFTRQELGLPENGFVFCCFNNNYKITPTVFDAWMRILSLVEGSVLWLLADNPAAKNNLIKEAASRGIESSRLIFADRMPLAEHLARHRQADLFLDTLPCNAHTTASDALWAGLPVLTLIGKSFAGRVAASLLNAIGLPELITTSQEQYEALAIDLATNRPKLAAIKQKLAHNRLTTPLFDSPLFTKHLEAAYIKMYERYQNDLPPDPIYIA